VDQPQLEPDSGSSAPSGRQDLTVFIGRSLIRGCRRGVGESWSFSSPETRNPPGEGRESCRQKAEGEITAWQRDPLQIATLSQGGNLVSADGEGMPECRSTPQSGLHPEGKPLFAQQLAEAVASAPLSAMDELSHTLWKAFAAGLLDDEQAQHLTEVIHARRSLAKAKGLSGRAWSYFPPPRPPQGPRKRVASIVRRRQLAASGPLPPALAARFTQGELATLRIVGDEVRRAGCCTKTIAELAARAGVCVTLARGAIKQARLLGLLTVEERRRRCDRNLANVVRIVSSEWTAWLSKGGALRNLQPTGKKSFEKRVGGGQAARNLRFAGSAVNRGEVSNRDSHWGEIHTGENRSRERTL
jgi:hypothetical protein